MPRRCTICTHKRRAEIEREYPYLSFRRIASHFGVGEKAVERHQECIAEALAAARKESEIRYGININEEAARCFSRLNRLFDACQDYLVDCDDQTRYNLDPRAEDIFVTYTEQVGEGKTRQRKERLSSLLKKIESSLGVTVEASDPRHADPRELILKTVDRIATQMDIWAKMSGLYKQPAENPETRKQRVADSIRHYLQIYWEEHNVRKTVEDAIREIGPGLEDFKDARPEDFRYVEDEVFLVN